MLKLLTLLNDFSVRAQLDATRLIHLHHPLTIVFYIKLEAAHDLLSLLVALEVATEALGGRRVTDLLSLEAARPGTDINLTNNTATLTIQKCANGRHGGFRASAGTV